MHIHHVPSTGGDSEALLDPGRLLEAAAASTGTSVSVVTAERRRLHLRKDNGLVRDVFRTHHMTDLRGNVGLGHVRYPTAGSSSCAEAQPLYTNYPQPLRRELRRPGQASGGSDLGPVSAC